MQISYTSSNAIIRETLELNGAAAIAALVVLKSIPTGIEIGRTTTNTAGFWSIIMPLAELPKGVYELRYYGSGTSTNDWRYIVINADGTFTVEKIPQVSPADIQGLLKEKITAVDANTVIFENAVSINATKITITNDSDNTISGLSLTKIEQHKDPHVDYYNFDSQYDITSWSCNKTSPYSLAPKETVVYILNTPISNAYKVRLTGTGIGNNDISITITSRLAADEIDAGRIRVENGITISDGTGKGSILSSTGISVVDGVNEYARLGYLTPTTFGVWGRYGGFGGTVTNPHVGISDYGLLVGDDVVKASTFDSKGFRIPVSDNVPVANPDILEWSRIVTPGLGTVNYSSYNVEIWADKTGSVTLKQPANTNITKDDTYLYSLDLTSSATVITGNVAATLNITHVDVNNVETILRSTKLGIGTETSTISVAVSAPSTGKLYLTLIINATKNDEFIITVENISVIKTHYFIELNDAGLQIYNNSNDYIKIGKGVATLATQETTMNDLTVRNNAEFFGPVLFHSTPTQISSLAVASPYTILNNTLGISTSAGKLYGIEIDNTDDSILSGNNPELVYNANTGKWCIGYRTSGGTGSQSGTHALNALLTESNLANPTFTGTVTITGNLVVTGDHVTQNVATIEVADNTILLNRNETGVGVTAGIAGIEIERGSATNYQFVFDESTDSFKVGQIGSLQSVATREDSPTDTYFARWDAASNKFNTFDLFGTANSWSQQQTYTNTVKVLRTASGNYLLLSAGPGYNQIRSFSSTAAYHPLSILSSNFNVDTNAGTLSFTGAGSFDGVFSAADLQISGTSIFDRANTWDGGQTINNNLVINSGTSDYTRLFFQNNGTMKWIVDSRHDVSDAMAWNSADNTFKMILGQDGSLTLGSTAGTGTGPLYAGRSRFSGLQTINVAGGGIVNQLNLQNRTHTGSDDGISINFEGYYNLANISAFGNAESYAGGNLALRTYKPDGTLNTGMIIDRFDNVSFGGSGTFNNGLYVYSADDNVGTIILSANERAYITSFNNGAKIRTWNGTTFIDHLVLHGAGSETALAGNLSISGSSTSTDDFYSTSGYFHVNDDYGVYWGDGSTGISGNTTAHTLGIYNNNVYALQFASNNDATFSGDIVRSSTTNSSTKLRISNAYFDRVVDIGVSDSNNSYIQAKLLNETAWNLQLNPSGGTVYVGAGGLSVGASGITSSGDVIRKSSADISTKYIVDNNYYNRKMVIGVDGTNDAYIQGSNSSDVAYNLKLNPNGGTVYVGSGGLNVNNNTTLNSDGTVQWGSSTNGGKLSWDENKAYLHALAGNILSLGANGSGDMLVINTNGDIDISHKATVQNLAVIGNTYRFYSNLYSIDMDLNNAGGGYARSMRFGDSYSPDNKFGTLGFYGSTAGGFEEMFFAVPSNSEDLSGYDSTKRFSYYKDGKTATRGMAEFYAQIALRSDSDGSGSYHVFTSNAQNKALIGLGGSVLGGSASDLDIYTYSGPIHLASNQGLALTLDNNHNTIVEQSISGTGFVSGYFGSGWKIDKASNTFEIDNVIVRNSLRTHIFQKDVVKVVSGMLAVTQNSSEIRQDSASTENAIYLKEDIGSGAYCWYKDDGVADVIVGIKFHTTSAGAPDSSWKGYKHTIVVDSGGGTFKVGGTILRVDGGGIVIDANSTGNPFIDIYDGVSAGENTWTEFGSPTKTKVRLGKQTGITSATFGQLQSYGLYSNRAYLEEDVWVAGNIWALTGGIGGSKNNPVLSVDSHSLSMNPLGASGHTFYVGKIGKNIVKYSQEHFDDASYWTKEEFSGTVTDNYTAAPDGTLTASRVNSSGGYLYQNNISNNTIVIAGKTLTFSIWMKLTGSTPYTAHIYIYGYNGAGGSNYRAETECPLTSEWKRFSVTYTFLSNETSAAFSVLKHGSWGDMCIWGAQIEEGMEPTEYQKTDAITVAQSNILHGMWASLGGFCGTPQNPLIGLDPNGLTVKHNGDYYSRIGITPVGSQGFYIGDGINHLVQFTSDGTNKIAIWNVTPTSIQTGAFNTEGTMYFGNSGLSLGTAFKVTYDGSLLALNADVTGSIHAGSGGFGGSTADPAISIESYGIKVKSTGTSTSLSNSTISIGNVTGDATSAIKLANTGSTATSGLFGYDNSGNKLFSLPLSGNASIAGTTFNGNALWSANYEEATTYVSVPSVNCGGGDDLGYSFTINTADTYIISFSAELPVGLSDVWPRLVVGSTEYEVNLVNSSYNFYTASVNVTNTGSAEFYMRVYPEDLVTFTNLTISKKGKGWKLNANGAAKFYELEVETALNASSGNIGGFEITSSSIQKNGGYNASGSMYFGESGFSIGQDAFHVSSSGIMYASGGTFVGTITGSSGVFGDVTLNSTGIHGTGYSLTGSGIVATSGSIANMIMASNSLTFPTIHNNSIKISSGDISIASIPAKSIYIGSVDNNKTGIFAFQNINNIVAMYNEDGVGYLQGTSGGNLVFSLATDGSNTIAGFNFNATQLSSSNLTGGGDGTYTTAGLVLNSAGWISTKNFTIDSSGNAKFKGAIEAASVYGTITLKTTSGAATLCSMGFDGTNLVLSSNMSEIILSSSSSLITFTTDTVNASGSVIKSAAYQIAALNTSPASASATGFLGDIRFTSDYIYVCTATNTWKRAALTTW